ncbi:MAG: polysaccharide biosynthesis C-terminal domain-containing protein [Microthrixaceae bacterium]
MGQAGDGSGDWDLAWEALDSTEAPREAEVESSIGDGPNSAFLPPAGRRDDLLPPPGPQPMPPAAPPSGGEPIPSAGTGPANEPAFGADPQHPQADWVMESPSWKPPTRGPIAEPEPTASGDEAGPDEVLPHRSPAERPQAPTDARPVVPEFDPSPYEALIPEDQRLEVGPDGRPRLRRGGRGPADLGPSGPPEPPQPSPVIEPEPNWEAAGDAYANDAAGGFVDPVTHRTSRPPARPGGRSLDEPTDDAERVVFEPVAPGSVASFGVDGISLVPMPTDPNLVAAPASPTDIWAEIPSAQLDPEELEDDDQGDDDGGGDDVGDRTQLGGVARGGALNLGAALIYGVANFALLWVLNHELGTAAAGVALVGIAAFNILARVAELGSATGLIRWISRLRAVHAADVIPRMMTVGLVPVMAISLLFAWFLGAQSGRLAEVFANGEGVTQLSRVFLALAPLLPIAVLETVLVSATRGFDVMWPQAAIEKVGRALLLPIAVLVTTRLGGDVVAVARVWALTNLVALIPAVMVWRRLLATTRTHPADLDDPRVAFAAPGTAHAQGDPGFDRNSWAAAAKAFWGFSAPRAAGQTFEVSIAWVDTLLVSALVSTSAAGIYASGTRYVLLGAFISEAIMQVVGPRVSGLMAKERGRATSHLVRTAAGWQTALTWPIYLLAIGFAPVLLGVFGSEVLAAQGALIALSFGLMAFSLFGPAGSVILMGGRSSQAMGNAAIAVAFNLVGNLALIPWLGITGAGIVWALTLVLLVGLPAWQAQEQMHLDMVSWSALWTAGLATATIGVPALFFRVFFGATWTSLVLAGLTGVIAYAVGMWRFRSETGLDELITDPAQLRPGRLLARLRAGGPKSADRPGGDRSSGATSGPKAGDDPRRRPPNLKGGRRGR